MSAAQTQSGEAAPAMGKLWQSSSVAEPFSVAVKEAIEQRVSTGKPRPKLAGILATPSPPSIAYAEFTRRACEAVGIEFEIWRTWEPEAASDSSQAQDEAKRQESNGQNDLDNLNLEADVEDLIIAANANPSIHGVMVRQ